MHRSPSGSWQQTMHMVLALGWSDFLLKYRGTFLGYLWSLIGPLTQFVVIYYVFSVLMGVSIPHYPLYLFLGIIIWEHFALTTSACIAAPLQKMGMMQQISLPRIVFMLSVGWMHLIIFSSRLLIFVAFALFSGEFFPLGFLYIPLLILQISCLALGIGMFLSAFSLRFRDVGHLWGILLQFLFWLTPVMYASQRTDSVLQEFRKVFDSAPQSVWDLIHAFIKLQPLSVLIYDARRVIIFLPDMGMPSLVHAIGVTAGCLFVFVAGAAVYQRRSTFFLQEY